MSLKNKIKGRAILVLGLIAALDSSYHLLSHQYRKNKEAEIYETQSKSVQALLYYAGAIMGGYIDNIEHGELALYDSDYDSLEIKDVYVDIYLLNVAHDGKRGYVDVKYVWKYDTDSSLSPVSGSDSLWFIEKKDGRWEVVRIEELP